MIMSDFKKLPVIEIFLGEIFKEDDYCVAAGHWMYEGKRRGICEIKAPTDALKKPKKPKGNERMMAYAIMAYYVALRKNNSMSGKAALEAAEWLGVGDEKSITKAANNNKYSLPKNAVVVAYDDPLGIVALLEPNKIVMDSGKFFYHGMVRSWKVGDQKASEGLATLDGIDCDAVVSPIKKLNDRKSKT
jgi:hypothetical protein